MAVLQCMLHEAGTISRNRTAFFADDLRIQYGEWDLMVSATAGLLREAGIREGDRVALFMETGWALATLILALIRVGALACPLNTRLPLTAVKDQMAVIGATTLVARVRPESREALDTVTCLDPDGLVSIELTSGQAADRFDMAMDRPSTVIFTSGSTGKPKAVLHSYANHYYSAYGSNLNIRLRSGDCWLLSIPLYHVGGLGILFRCIQSGAAMAEVKATETLEQALARYPVTHCSLVPTQLRRLLVSEGFTPEIRKRLKVILLGGAPIPESLLTAARSQGLTVCPTYGLSEMASQVTTASPGGQQVDPASSGSPLRYRELRIASDGEILLRGSTLFQGYLEGESVRRPLDEDGWFGTGDLGRLTDANELVVTGRKDHMFVSGGENIHPEEIERALLAVQGVSQALVVPIADEEFGERPVAFIDPFDEAQMDHIRQTLSGQLPSFKIPDHFLAWPDAGGRAEPMKEDRTWFRQQAESRLL